MNYHHLKKNWNQKGFTLVEVLLGMMILTVAIVMASNLYMSAVRSNKVMTLNLKAYYLAQEGLEIVRNVRDTHWLHNLDWLSGAGSGGNLTKLEKEKVYFVDMGAPSRGWGEVSVINQMNSYIPWEVKESGDTNDDTDFYNQNFLVGNGIPEFYRHINILPYEKCGSNQDQDCPDFILVQSVVNFKDAGRDNEVVLEEVLTNWKKGVL